MKLSDYLNVIAGILTLLFILFLVGRSYNTVCFSWLEYGVSFAMLFGNMLINILSAIGR